MENLSIKSEDQKMEIASNEIKKDAKKKSIPAKKENAGKKKLEDANLSLLSKFDEKLNSMQISNSSNSSKGEYIYNYPSEWNKNDINGLNGKNWRNKRRNQLKSICNNIFFYAKGKNMIELNKSIASFEENYKSFYRINDYSIQSLSNSNDPQKNADISFALEIIKEMKGNKK